MWATLLPYLIKDGIPLAIALLEKSGALSEVQMLLLKGWVGLGNLQTSYRPEDFYNSPPNPTPSNIVTGHVPDDGYQKEVKS